VVPGVVPAGAAAAASSAAACGDAVPFGPAGPASAASSCGECGRAVTAARAAASAWIAGIAPGTAPSAGTDPAGSGPGLPWPAERESGAIPLPPAAASLAGDWAPSAPAPCALPAPRGTLAVAAGPASDGIAEGETTVLGGDMTPITATDPPAAASTSADAASARLWLVSTGERLGGPNAS
jgi:hypothetical protein